MAHTVRHPAFSEIIRTFATKTEANRWAAAGWLHLSADTPAPESEDAPSEDTTATTDNPSKDDN